VRVVPTRPFEPMSFPLFLAIPSPDLVLNLFASAGQLMGLVAVTAGGAVMRARSRDAAQRGSSSPWPLRVALLALCATGASFLLYHLRVQDLEQARLRANLTRPSIESGREVGDASLKTLSFSEQLAHPAQLSTDELQERIDRGERMNLIDVRETEEAEMGRIAGTWHRRYPDLFANRDGLQQEGVETILICYSGNRSSELVDAFAADGIQCRFIVGGYEKWISEGRALDLAAAADRKALREIPSYTNDDVLLDTEAVLEAVQHKGAIFVDVRYPDEFKAAHLPGAVNITMRRLTSAELDAALAALPAGPVILPCYDKRSSFFASLAGLRLTRMGREVLGRYTLPHEYFVPKGERDYVAAWNAGRAGETPFGLAREALSAALLWLQRNLGGSLVLAILALVVLCRAVLSPLTFGADVQQLRSKRLAPELAALRARFGADPVRQQRAEAQLRRRHGLHPLRSFAVSMLQLTVFLLLFSAVAAVAEGSTERLGWLTLGLPDPLYVLPVLVTALAAALVLVGVPRGTARLSRGRIIGASVVVVLIGALVHGLSSAVNLYLVVSLAWVHLQAALARRREARGTAHGRTAAHTTERSRARAEATLVVPLERALTCDGIGGKAQSLARLTGAGFPVPPGFVLPDAAFEGDTLAPRLVSDVLRAFDRLGARHVAVRSSGLDEDGSQHSYAGVFDTILHVERAGLLDALTRVRRSMSSERARAYSARARSLSATAGAVNGSAHDTSATEEPVRGAVVVQIMVPATHAGVLFTVHPGHTGRSLVELVAGLGEALVSGQASPEAFEFGRLSDALLEGGPTPLDLGPLLALGRAVEAHYGKPQDIEWAFAGEFMLLQSRDITADVTRGEDADAAFERERRRVVAHLAATCVGTGGVDRAAPRLVQNELVELLPEPTPYSAALMIDLWQPGNAVDLACRALGMPYTPTEPSAATEQPSPLLIHAFGQLVVDCEEDQRRRAQKPGALFGWRLARRAAELEQRVQGELSASGREAERLTRALDLTRLGTDELVHLHDEVRARFTTSTYTLAEQVNIAAEAFVKTAAQRLGRRGVDVSSLLGENLTTVVGDAHERLRKGDVAGFIARFGHRAPHDYELSEPRYSESRELVARLVSLGATMNGHGHKLNGAAAHAHNGKLVDVAAEPRLGRLDRLVLERARRFQALKEEAKHAALHEIALLRRVALELGRRIGLDSVTTFGLTPAELSASCSTRDTTAPAQALRRLEAQHEWSGRALPQAWSIDALERRARETLVPTVDAESGLLGIRVAGSGEVVGTVRVLRTAEDAADLLDGEVLVARFTDPRWTPVFPRAAGVITEVGGWLSHAAILAREMGLPAIVGAPGATRVLRTGDVVRLTTSGRVDVLARREAGEPMAAVGAPEGLAVRAVAQ
jgi:membrane protein insertase Oxa1/YidC/SpoIIIJ/phosphohistidine swiveling domain-containing protein/rhodanese-related sulfurtransferase